MSDILRFVPLNFALMAHPVNWLTVLLMVMLAGLGVALVTTASD